MPVRSQSRQYGSGFSYKPGQVAGSDTQQHDEEREIPLENKKPPARSERRLTTAGLKISNLIFYYVLLPYIIYVMQSGRFSQCPAFLLQTAKERDKKYSVKSP